VRPTQNPSSRSHQLPRFADALDTVVARAVGEAGLGPFTVRLDAETPHGTKTVFDVRRTGSESSVSPGMSNWRWAWRGSPPDSSIQLRPLPAAIVNPMPCTGSNHTIRTLIASWSSYDTGSAGQLYSKVSEKVRSIQSLVDSSGPGRVAGPRARTAASSFDRSNWSVTSPSTHRISSTSA
jgi:hypothetical protein